MWSKKIEIFNVDDIPYHYFVSHLREKKIIFFSGSSLLVLDTDSLTQILSIPDASSCPVYLEEKDIIIRRKENVLTSINIASGEESVKFKSHFNKDSHLIYLNNDVVADIKQEYENWELVKEEGQISKLDGTILYNWTVSSKVLFSDKSYLAIADSKNEITLLSKSCGEVKWKIIIDNAMNLKFQQQSQNLLIFSNDTSLIAVEKIDGTVKWEHKGNRLQSFVDTNKNQIIAINHEAITFLNKENGKVNAKFELPSEITLEGHLAHLDEGIIYFINISETADIWAFDSETYNFYNVIKIKSKEAGTRSILSKVAVIDSKLYLLDTHGVLRIYEKEACDA